MGRTSPLTFALFVAFLIVATLLPLSHAENPETFVLEGRIIVISLDENSSYEAVLDIEEDGFVQLTLDCNTCTGSLTSSNENANGSQNVILEVSEEDTVNIRITTTQLESVRFTINSKFSDSFPNVRPGPQDASSGDLVGVCTSADECMDTQRGVLSAVIDDAKLIDALQMGVLNTSADEYMVVDANVGDTLEWQWLNTLEDITVQMYFQNGTNEQHFGNTLSSEAGYTELNGQPVPVNWWIAPDNGRFIVRISSPVYPALWTAHAVIHTNTPTSPLIGTELLYGAELLGHGSTASAFDWNATTALEIHTRLGQVNLRVDQLLNGSWVTGSVLAMEQGDSQTIYPYPGNSGGRIIIEDSPVFAVELQTTEYSDNGSWLEAPSYRPADIDSDNASWPVVNLTEMSSGELTLAIHDTVDTYRFIVEGWEDSIHLVQFTITGNISGLEAQMWDVDQSTYEDLDTAVSVSTSESLKLSLKVGRGTHYLQIRHTNASNVTQENWGNDTASMEYIITPSYLLVDEGEEPWFPPSDDAVFWGGVVRWALGAAFLIPVIYLIVQLRRSREYGREIFSKKERLEWYRKCLDTGEADVSSSQKDLVRALHAVAQLTWEDGLEAWGKPALKHRTEGLDLAVWRIDHRMAKTESTWPLVVGVHVLDGEWDLAAVRFDAPGGQAYTVRHVEPRFLFQGEEVFIDTLKQGHRMFIMVELEGDAPSVDIELNGRLDTIPFAARIPETLVRGEEE